MARRVAITSAAAVVQEAGGVGLIVAKNPNDAFSPCAENFPCIEVDYEIGTQILFYIRSTRYLHVHIHFSLLITVIRFLLVLKL